MSAFTAYEFIEELKANQSDEAKRKNANFIEDGGKLAPIIGVRMKIIFDLTKKYSQMPLAEVNTLLDSALYEVRLGAVSIMDFKTREKGITEEERKALFDLYITRHDRINNWGLVDRSAPRVVGGYLQDKRRDILYELAKSDRISERRTAIIATLRFINKQHDVEDALSIAEILLNHKEELIHTALGSTLHYVGMVNKPELEKFLDKYHAVMPRVTLRLAIRKQDDLKKKYMKS